MKEEKLNNLQNIENPNDNLPDGWVEEKLENFLKLIRNGLVAKQEKTKVGIPISRIETISSGQVDFNKVGYVRNIDKVKEAKYLLQKNDILFSHINSDLHLGKTAIFNSDLKLIHGMNLLLLRFEDSIISPVYINYNLTFQRFKGNFIAIAQHAVNQSSLNQDKIKSLLIPLPPLNEQKRIVDKIEQLLSDLDKGEDLIKTIQKQLKTYRQSVLQSAITGELTKDWRKNNSNIESAEDLIKRISLDICVNQKDIKHLDKSILPDIPKSWTWSTLPQLGEFGRGKSKHRPRNDHALYENGKYPFLQTGVIRNSSGRVSKYDKLYNEFGLKQSKLWPKGTVCITIAANIAESAILDIEACFPDSVVGLIPHKEISGEFIEFFIRTAKEKLDRFAPATAQKNINLEILKAVAVPIPPYQEQLAIYEKANKILSNILSIEKWCNEALIESKSLRQSILKSAFSGQLVPQDPNDEPASKLLEKIKANNQKLESITNKKKT